VRCDARWVVGSQWRQRRVNAIVAGVMQLLMPPIPGVSTPVSALCGKLLGTTFSIPPIFLTAAYAATYPPPLGEAVKLLLAYQGS
jgi:hypothetical protein